VNFASPTLDPQTGAMVVRAEFPNPQGQLLPGQFVRAIVSGAFRPNAIFVPQKSVFQGQKGMYVFVIDSANKVKTCPVVVGAWYGDFWVIKEGLKSGDVVIADGVNKVREGATVKILSFLEPPKVGKK
jgi:membrane fusion protein (multidrug efflux system)